MTAPIHAAEKDVKEIKYRGGIIDFVIPKHWIEEYEPEGGGMFYDDAPNTGTLRLNIITAKSPKPLSSDAAYEMLENMKSVNASSVQRLKNGNAMATSVQRSKENGQEITLFWWYVANPVPPNHMRIANFSYTVLSSQESSDPIQHELQLLTESIKNAKFHATLGE